MQYDFLLTKNDEKDTLKLSVCRSASVTSAVEGFVLEIKYGYFFGEKYPKFQVDHVVTESCLSTLPKTSKEFQVITEFAKAFMNFPGLMKVAASGGRHAEISQDARNALNDFVGFTQVQSSGEAIGYVEDRSWEPKTLPEIKAVNKAWEAADAAIHRTKEEMIDFALDTRNYELFMQLTSEKSNA